MNQDFCKTFIVLTWGGEGGAERTVSTEGHSQIRGGFRGLDMMLRTTVKQ